MRQSITITGFGNLNVNDCIESIHGIHQSFSRSLPIDSLEPWTPSKYDGYPAIDMGNRYFTDCRDVGGEAIMPFKDTVDPDGILQGLTGQAFVHTEENEVEYFEEIPNSSGSSTK